MTKIYRILGKRGRVTIPYAFRQQVGFGFNDVLSFTIQEDNSVLVRREKICDNCGGKVAAQEKDAPATLLDFRDSLPPTVAGWQAVGSFREKGVNQ